MKFVACLAGGSLLVAIVLSAVSRLAGLGAEKEIWFGMFGPTLASVISWIAIERQKYQNSQQMLKCIIQAFVIKSVFFGAYIIVLVKTDQVSPGSFVSCFAFFYLALHMAEAIKLRETQRRMAANDANGQ